MPYCLPNKGFDALWLGRDGVQNLVGKALWVKVDSFSGQARKWKNRK